MIDDHTERARALDPNRSFIVQAPAGSGKTTLLAHRVLRLLTTVKFPEQVIAITFTRKAAEEMRSRIIGALELARGVEPADEFQRTSFALAKATLEHDERLEWDLIAQPSRLRIMTIDALSASVVRQMPVTARISGVQIVDDDAHELYQEASRNALSAIADGGEPRKTVARMLHHVDNDWAKLERLVAEMLARRDQWLRVLAPQADRRVLDESFTRVVEYELARTAALIPDQIKAQLIEVCDFAGGHMRADAHVSRISALAGLTALPAATFEHFDRWQGLVDLLLTKDGKWRKRVDKSIGFPPKAANSGALKAQLADVISLLAERPAIRQALATIRRLPNTAFDDDEWTTCRAMVELMKAATAHLILVAERRGRTDFVAIALAANEALGANEAPSDLALSMDYRVEHVLVDEFQDTSLTQLQLIERLTAGWTGEDGRTLFLVGDPMQSIYRFRQADVRLFTHVLERGFLGSAPLEYVQLTENFRSQAGLIEWVNEAIPPALETMGTLDVPFAEQRTGNPKTEPAFHVYPAGVGDGDEAVRVLDIVSALRAQASGASIAILVRSRAHLGRITSCLIENDYQVAAQEIQPLAELPWIGDLLALTRALLQPADRIAWLAVLRAPWCGLTLASLHDLAQQPGTVLQAMLEEQRTHALDPGDAVRLSRVCEILARALEAAGTWPLAELVEHTWLTLGGPACVEHDNGFDDVRTFFALLAEMERDGIVPTAERVEQHTSALFSVTPGARVDAIEVMTIHRAKGLEFDYVIIPGAGRRPRSEQKRLFLWREDVDYEQRPALLMAAIPTASSSALYDYLRARETDEMAAEAVRLLYVAVTRARCAVHMLGHARRDRAGKPAPLKGSFIAMLWPVVQPRFEAYFESLAKRERVEHDESGSEITLRRLDTESIEGSAVPWPEGSQLNDTETRVEFDWAGATAKHIGTVAHRLLQALDVDAGTTMGPAWMRGAAHFARGQLRALGVAENELVEGVRQVSDALEATLSSERGRWLFSAAHIEPSAEMPLSTVANGRLAHAIIDRSFVDAEGRRWIVDFKTGRHAGGSLDAYLDSEVARYRPQLERYGRILAGLDQRPIMLGLYFPLLDAWREWPYERA